MAAKSILDVEVNDDKFKAFMGLFDRYTEELAKVPSKWAEASKSTDGLKSNFLEMTAAILAQNELFEERRKSEAVIASQQAAEAVRQKEAARELSRVENDRIKAQDERDKRAGAEREAARQAWVDTGKLTKNIALNIYDATTSLVKWTGIIGALGGLLGGGGLFGIERLAQGAASDRRSAGGLGVSSGEQKAFGINFNRFFDADSVLGNVANAKSDYSKRWAFSAMGVPSGDVENKDPAALAAEMAIRAKKIFDESDGSQQQAQSRGLLQFYSMEDLRRLHGTSMGTLEKAERDYARDRGTLNVSTQTQDKWQDFVNQMERAGAQINKVFVEGLVPLAPGFEKLSAAFADLVASALADPDLKKWIDDAGHGLEWLAKEIGTPEFKQGVRDFVTGVEEMGKKIVAGMRWLGLIPSGSAADMMGNDDRLRGKGGLIDFGVGSPLWNGLPPGEDTNYVRSPRSQNYFHPPDVGMKPSSTEIQGRERQAAYYFQHSGWSPAATAGMLGYIHEEDSTFDPDAFNPEAGGRGAQGIGQWRGPRLDDFKNRYGHDMLDHSISASQRLQEQIDFMDFELKGKEKITGDALRRISDPREAAGTMISGYGRSSQEEQQRGLGIAAGAATHYMDSHIVIDINNNTGGSATVSTSQLPQ